MLLLGFIAKPHQDRKDVIPRELLGTDMLQALVDSNYTIYHTDK